jgi:hypothetical protein
LREIHHEDTGINERTFKKIKNRERSTNRRQIVGAFIAGMVITAALAQILVNADVFSQREIHENIVPAPQSTPDFSKPDVPYHTTPAYPVERHMNELVYALI